MGYYIDDDGDPIETDDVPEDDDADLQPDFWTGPAGPVDDVTAARREAPALRRDASHGEP